MAGQMTIEEIQALPAVLGIETAGRALGLSRQHAYTLRMSDEFPVTVHKIGSRYKVSKADVLRYLGIEPSAHDVTTPPATGDSNGRMSSVVKTRSGKVIDPDKVYRFNGRQWRGDEIVAVAQMLGVVA